MAQFVRSVSDRYLQGSRMCLGIVGVLLMGHTVLATQTPAYVQSNYAVPQTPQTTVTVPYTATQRATDLNVVVVGWNDTTAQIRSVTDTARNVYQLAIGPTQMSGSLSQSIFYAKNIVAAAPGTNAVTVTFSTAAVYPDIRILEYSGINPVNSVDVSVGATNNNGTATSGAVTTTNATDLLVGANYVVTSTTAAGSGFTPRLITAPDGDIVEDAVVTATGSYSATAPLGQPGPWVTQMVAFRAAGNPTPSPTPKSTPTPTITPSPTPSTSITLAWNADSATSDPGTNPTGYKLHIGFSSGNYTQTENVGKVTTATVSSLKSGSTYYFVVTAYDAAGIQSPYSNQVSYTVP